MAILAVSVLAILSLQSKAMFSSGRAQEVSIATMLSGHQMAQVLIAFEKEFAKARLPDDKRVSGDFSQMGYPNYRWDVKMRRVEIPPPPIPEEAAGELVSKITDNIAKQISEATREVKLTIFWKTIGEEEESIEITTHLVNLKGSKMGV